MQCVIISVPYTSTYFLFSRRNRTFSETTDGNDGCGTHGAFVAPGKKSSVCHKCFYIIMGEFITNLTVLVRDISSFKSSKLLFVFVKAN